MKKTFKVKNILNNKKKYNFKTELLALAALVLLTPSLSTSCKKDNINPVKTEEELKKEKEEKLKSLIRGIIKTDIKDNPETGVDLRQIFLINAFGGLEYPSFEDTLNGTNRRIPKDMTEEEFKKKYGGNENVSEEYYGVIKTVKEILNSNEEVKVLDESEINLLNKLKDSSIMYLKLRNIPIKTK